MTPRPAAMETERASPAATVKNGNFPRPSVVHIMTGPMQRSGPRRGTADHAD